jgi:hypothetical protein
MLVACSLPWRIAVNKDDAFAKIHKMAKQKFRPTRLGGFSGAKAYIVYVEVLKKRRNAGGRTFCDAIKDGQIVNRRKRGVND